QSKQNLSKCSLTYTGIFICISTLADSKDVNSYDLRFYAQIIDLFFIIAVFLIVKFYDIEHYVFFSIIISILIFFFSIILWKQSIGQKFMHLKVYYWNGKVALDYRFLFLRYIFKYIFFPLSFITFLTSKMLIHDIILKTYEAPK
ncbi:hypothetical protein ACFFH5_05145, partial [Epilithonimonas hispanica]|uniref:hypothetical protein n=1 Tax=Epilithonimonas hispanica TaxID=358687 RepID=UPI0035E63D59